MIEIALTIVVITLKTTIDELQARMECANVTKEPLIRCNIKGYDHDNENVNRVGKFHPYVSASD